MHYIVKVVKNVLDFTAEINSYIYIHQFACRIMLLYR